MGDVAVDKQHVIQHVFSQYDTENVGELNAVQVHNLHADIRIGGISMPQVQASMQYVCATDTCHPTELYDLLQEMDRRYFLIQDFRWEFSMMDREMKDTIPEDKALWFVQSVHGRYFSRKKWQAFARSRPLPGSNVSFAELEVMLCDIPDRQAIQKELDEEERERAERLRKQKEREEEEERERERLRKKMEEDRKREEEERKRRQLEEEERRRREEEERKKREEEEEEERERQRLRKLQEEEERKRREEEERYRDAEIIKEKAEKDEKDAEDELKKLRKRKSEEQDEKSRKKIQEEEDKLAKKHTDHKNKRIRYQLKVAIKARDKFQLEFSITEMKKNKVKDEDMDLEKAERLLKELTAGDNLKKAMTKRELEELEKALNFVKTHGFEGKLANEVMEANKLLSHLRRLERIRHEILELKQSTVAEIRSYQSPPAVVHTVMTATFLLLGHKEKETKDWKAVQALVGKTGKESLKRRCLELKAANVQPAVADRAAKLMKKYELDEVRDVSAGAATFFVWATAMTEEVMHQHASK